VAESPYGRAGRPTLEAVAELAGVSRATASRVITGSPRVSARSRAAVEAAVSELGYVPNLAARSLVTQRTDAVAVVVSEPESRVFTDPFFGAMIRGISRGLAAEGLQMLLLMVQSPEDAERAARFLSGGHVDGALMYSLHRSDPLPEVARQVGLPTAYGGRPWTNTGTELYVDADNRGGARNAVTYLRDQGRHAVATITGPLDQFVSIDRLAGFRDVFPDTRDELIVAADFTQEGGEVAMDLLLAQAPTLDAVFCASDLMAAGALRSLRRHGREVPRDVAVVGFDDHDQVARWTDPPLTTIHQDVELMGHELARLLATVLRGEPTPESLVMPTRLVVRASA